LPTWESIATPGTKQIAAAPVIQSELLTANAITAMIPNAKKVLHLPGRSTRRELTRSNGYN
jgi:hypothetical protein